AESSSVWRAEMPVNPRRHLLAYRTWRHQRAHDLMHGPTVIAEHEHDLDDGACNTGLRRCKLERRFARAICSRQSRSDCRCPSRPLSAELIDGRGAITRHLQKSRKPTRSIRMLLSSRKGL